MQLNLSILITYYNIHMDNDIGFFFLVFLWKNFNFGISGLVLANFEVCSNL